MSRMLGAVAVLAVLAGEPATAQDLRAILQATAQKLGATDLDSIEFSGTGWIANVGQSYGLGEDWPRFEVTEYARAIDFDAEYSHESLVRRRGRFPDRGGGLPFVGDQRVTEVVSGPYAWNLQGDTPVPQHGYMAGVPTADFRRLDILLTPHGFVQAALAADDVTAITIPIAGASNGGLSQDGRRVTVVSFTALDKYRVNGTINDEHLVEIVSTWVPNPVYGDMLFEQRYTDYEDFDGVLFPRVVHEHQGDPVFNPAHNSMEIEVTSVRANPRVAGTDVLAAVRRSAPPPVRAVAEPLAEGVWLVAGGSHHSVAVEFDDFMTVIEAPLNEERSLAVIAEVERLRPGKPIRYLVSTHHHFDHLGGIRTYLAQGATIVTHERNRDFYEDVVFHPAGRTLQPDRLATYYPMFTASRRPAPIEVVNQKYVISDGRRVLELYPVAGLPHVEGMLFAYLPAERIAVNADMYSPPPADAPLPPADQRMLPFYRALERYGLEVDTHVPIHGRPGPHARFVEIVSAAQ